MARCVHTQGPRILVETIANYLSQPDLFYERRYSHTAMTNPDFVLLAKAMGVHAIRCHTAEELPAKMKEFLEYDNNKPIVMECLVEKNEHVFPMVRSSCTCPLPFVSSLYVVFRLQVAAGKALHEQLLHPMLRGKQ